jgi:hypothetical protein
MSVLKPGNRNFGQTNTGSSKKQTTGGGNIAPFKRTGTSNTSGKSVGNSKGQAGGGTTKRSGGQITGGKNGGF